MQEVWISGISLDVPLAKKEQEIWQSWLKDLSKISVPRCYISANKNLKRIELHIFCDVRKKSYAAVAYWRFESENGVIEKSIIARESKVAPLKLLSIPRLELQAALLGSRLYKR